jgi:hypothetical protein
MGECVLTGLLDGSPSVERAIADGILWWSAALQLGRLVENALRTHSLVAKLALGGAQGASLRVRHRLVIR